MVPEVVVLAVVVVLAIVVPALPLAKVARQLDSSLGLLCSAQAKPERAAVVPDSVRIVVPIAYSLIPVAPMVQPARQLAQAQRNWTWVAVASD